jgi:hypothetical protein
MPMLDPVRASGTLRLMETTSNVRAGCCAAATAVRQIT